MSNYDMTPDLLAWIKSLISKGDTRPFYRIWIWKRLRKEVLVEDRKECQWCKVKGLHARATVVHNNQYLDKYPELALSKTYIYQGKEYRNLVSLCRDCHERHHNYRAKLKSDPLTPERW
jgi:5-methylcytosine-specific restriction endonuclease McrA